MTRSLESGPDGLGRFSQPGILILISLAGGAKHGYAMAQDIATWHGERLGPGSLYGALARLAAQGLVESVPSRGRRRPYRLTPAGAASLRARLGDLREFARLGLARLGEE
jgi:DNA-binding PadR family transcriptional regulator